MTTMSSTASLQNQKPQAVLFRIPRRGKDQPREQVAAVCYRIHESRLEFLLVQTRRGRRWIFPKGGVEPGLTRSQSAAVEAYEEAGVHGSIEEAPFARYAIEDVRKQLPNELRNRQGRSSNRRPLNVSRVAAYLCAVTWLGIPCEKNRKRTWCSAEKAKKRLGQDRERRFARELCQVIDHAVQRIERLNRCDTAANDGLRRVQFEVAESIAHGNWQTILPETRLPDGRQYSRQPVIISGGAKPTARRILQLGPAFSAAQQQSLFLAPSRRIKA
jgi:8-oxo-dGTP pyrophosphatase MutT (NUDIX family)